MNDRPFFLCMNTECEFRMKYQIVIKTAKIKFVQLQANQAKLGIIPGNGVPMQFLDKRIKFIFARDNWIELKYWG